MGLEVDFERLESNILCGKTNINKIIFNSPVNHLIERTITRMDFDSIVSKSVSIRDVIQQIGIVNLEWWGLYTLCV